MASGKDASDAEKEADKRVTGHFIKAEKGRRAELVAPLVKSIQQIELRTGCWAMTVTTKRKSQEKEAVIIEQYDPFQPEEKCWTLLSYNGGAPNEKTQTAYRAKKFKAKTKRHEEKLLSERITKKALRDDLSCTQSDLTGESVLAFDHGPIEITGIGHCPRTIEIYKIDSQNQRLTSLQRQFLGPLSVLGMHMDEFVETKEFAVLHADSPPFLVRHTKRFRAKAFGKDSGLIEEEVLYTDYRKVKCYDERFEVNAGELRILEMLPTPSGF